MTDSTADNADHNGQDDSVPRSLDEAIELFGPVMATRRISRNARPFYVGWIRRFDDFRIRNMGRSFKTIVNSDVVDFLRDQQRRFSPPDWQLKQAQQSVVLFLRNVIGLTGVDSQRRSPVTHGWVAE